MLKGLRVVFAIIVFGLLTLFFLDFAELLPESFKWLARIQFIPAVMAHAFIIVCILVLVTLLFGRIYCSVVCPLGIMQDISGWLSRKASKKKKRYRYSRPKTVLRWSVFIVFAVAFVAGFSVVLNLLDPYAAYGRIAANIFRPLYLLGNNLLAWMFTSAGNYTFYKMDVSVLDVSALIVAVVTLVVVGFMAWKRGRLYCNSICPVGTLLGFFSKYAFFKIRIDEDKCNGCGVCASKCKSSCIDTKEKKVDYSRCVDCFNCIGSCKQGALLYKGPKVKIKKTSLVPGVAVLAETEHAKARVTGKTADCAVPLLADTVPDAGRRRFITTSVAALFVIPEILAIDTYKLAGVSRVPFVRKHPVTPPGSQSLRHLMRYCTACHLCVSRCPSRVIKPASAEYGLRGFMQPVMFFDKGFCNFDCTVCGDVCPNGAIKPLSIDEKHMTQTGRVVFIEENCIVVTEGTNCGACSEHCPTQAVRMEPYGIGGLTIPVTDPDICVGCGGCEFVCPVRPFKAIYVEGNPEHAHREKFDDDAMEAPVVDDFGF